MHFWWCRPLPLVLNNVVKNKEIKYKIDLGLELSSLSMYFIYGAKFPNISLTRSTFFYPHIYLNTWILSGNLKYHITRFENLCFIRLNFDWTEISINFIFQGPNMFCQIIQNNHLILPIWPLYSSLCNSIFFNGN